jgi:hypothetical protein
MSCLCSDSRETRTALTDSFRLERGGQFESGFQKSLDGFLSGLSVMIGGDARTPPRHRLWVLKSGKRVQAYTGYTPHETTGSSCCVMVTAFQTCLLWALGCFAQSLLV